MTLSKLSEMRQMTHRKFTASSAKKLPTQLMSEYKKLSLQTDNRYYCLICHDQQKEGEKDGNRHKKDDRKMQEGEKCKNGNIYQRIPCRQDIKTEGGKNRKRTRRKRNSKKLTPQKRKETKRVKMLLFLQEQNQV